MTSTNPAKRSVEITDKLTLLSTLAILEEGQCLQFGLTYFVVGKCARAEHQLTKEVLQFAFTPAGRGYGIAPVHMFEVTKHYEDGGRSAKPIDDWCYVCGSSINDHAPRKPRW